MKVKAVGLPRRSGNCAGAPVECSPSSPNSSFVALQASMREIQQLERLAAGASLDARLLEHALELSDTACFSVSAAEAQYSCALAEYNASFSPLRRRLKRLGRRTQAYHAVNVQPRQARLIEARAVFKRASELRQKVERSLESVEPAECLLEICHPSTGTFTELYTMISGHHDFCSRGLDDSF